MHGLNLASFARSTSVSTRQRVGGYHGVCCVGFARTRFAARLTRYWCEGAGPAFSAYLRAIEVGKATCRTFCAQLEPQAVRKIAVGAVLALDGARAIHETPLLARETRFLSRCWLRCPFGAGFALLQTFLVSKGAPRTGLSLRLTQSVYEPALLAEIALCDPKTSRKTSALTIKTFEDVFILFHQGPIRQPISGISPKFALLTGSTFGTANFRYLAYSAPTALGFAFVRSCIQKTGLTNRAFWVVGVEATVTIQALGEAFVR